MENRLGRTLRVFLVVLATAGLYRLVAVPLVERRPRDSAVGQELSASAVAAVKARAARRNAQLVGVFPPDAWELKQPNTLESRQMRLLFDQWHPMSTAPDERRVQLFPCTLVILPEPGREGGQTLVLQAPQGAVLEFDEPFDLSSQDLPTRLLGASLRGQVTIRGTPSAPGAADDFEIVTRDVELEEMEIRTPEAVQFRYGRSSGSGRAMVARLLPGAGGSEKGPSIGGVDTIRLDRDVKLRLEGLDGGLLPGAEGIAGTAPAAPVGPNGEAEAVPVFVSCRGNLCLNVSANVISLEDHVDVVRTLPGGGLDQLACDLLAVVLRRAGQGGETTGGLEPVEIQAKGNPVVARSASAGLEARATRLGYEIATRRIVLDGEQPVSLTYQGSEMEARSIDATPGPAGSPGNLMAVGPGWLKSRSSGAPPVTARWRKWLRVRADGAEHVASLSGDADVQVDAQGRLKAGEIHLWFAPQAGPAPAAAPPGVGLSGVKPSRMLARSMVEVDVEQLTARTDKMEVWFKHEAPPAEAAPAAPPTAAPAGPSAAVAPAVGPLSAPAAAPQQASAPPPPRERSTGRFVVSGGLVRGLVTVSAEGPQVDELSLEGQVHVIEEPDAAARAAGRPAEDAVELRGEQLQITRALRFDARAVVHGKPATVSGRGVDLQGPVIEVDRGRNRLSVDGAGSLAFPLAGGLPGVDSLVPASAARAPVAPDQDPARVEVAWQRRMDFDGTTARFAERVVASSTGSSLRAGVLDVTLSRPVDFASDPAKRRGPADRPEVSRIAGQGKVRIEYDSVAPGGEQSVFKLFLEDFQADVASGDVVGTGPGQLSMVRFGAPVGFDLAVPGAAVPGIAPQPAVPAAPAAEARPDELTYYGVDFQRGLRGNYRRRVVEFHQRVEAICGPVPGWNHRLDIHAAGGLPPRCMAMTSDILSCGVAPSAPGRRRESIEASAFGNVLVEAESFTGRSARLSWSEAKDMVVFEGDGRTDAQLYHQPQVGAPTSNASAGRIVFWPGQRRVEVDDARYLDLDQFGAGGGKSPMLPGLGGSKPKPTPALPVQQPLPGT